MGKPPHHGASNPWPVTRLGEEPRHREALVAHLVSVFNDPLRYSQERMDHEVAATPSDRHKAFFMVRDGETILGAAGVKSADWASDTWILYLSAVHPDWRGQGIGRQLIEARIRWIKTQQTHGRVIVSTGKPKRYRSLGFRQITRETRSGKYLMLLEF